MDTYAALLTRRSVRTYAHKPVEAETLIQVVGAAMHAPSARDNRPWEFIVITDRQLLDTLSLVRPYWIMLKNAPAAIVVLRNVVHYTSPTVAFSVQDCAAATENLLLAARDAGLGGVWLGLHPLEAEQTKVREILNIPDNISPFAVVALGYPAVQYVQQNRFDPSKLHWQHY